MYVHLKQHTINLLKFSSGRKIFETTNPSFIETKPTPMGSISFLKCQDMSLNKAKIGDFDYVSILEMHLEQYKYSQTGIGDTIVFHHVNI